MDGRSDNDALPITVSETNSASGAPPIPLPCIMNAVRSKASLNCSDVRAFMEKQLEYLSAEEKKVVTDTWTTFSQSSMPQRDLILTGILLGCSTDQLSYVSNCLRPLLKVDLITKLPKELSLRILSFLDAKSLVQASSVSRAWRVVANDDTLWRTLCDQHINKKCTKCGWGLPLLLDDYLRRKKAELQLTSQKRTRETEDELIQGKDDCFESPEGRSPQRPRILTPAEFSKADPFRATIAPVEERADSPVPSSKSFWKIIYKDRLNIERNWRRGKFIKKSIDVHPSGVHCQQANQDLIITGTYSSTVDIFSIKTGKRLRVLQGHLAAIRDLYFDDVRLVTVSLDSTVRVWCYRQGLPKFVIPAPGAKCLHFDKVLLAVGTVNGSIHLWNFSNTTRHTLVGHRDSVTKVRIHKGEFLISSSEDGTARLWDLQTLECLRVFRGHAGPVTCFQFVIPNQFPLHGLRSGPSPIPSSPLTCSVSSVSISVSSPSMYSRCEEFREGASLSTILQASSLTHSQLHKAPLLVTGSADSTLRTWSLQTGQCLRQSLGHLGEVSCLDMDSLRIISGSMDGTVKVWDLDSGKCMHTLVGDTQSPVPVLCASLADTRILAGAGDGRLYMWDCSSDSHPACSLPALLSPAEPTDGWEHHFN